MAATASELGADAERELDEAIAFLEGSRGGSGFRFLADVEHTLQMAVQFPYIGRKNSRRMRVVVMTGWPYKIVYSVEGDIIFVWAIAHDSRKPGYWRKRARR